MASRTIAAVAALMLLTVFPLPNDIANHWIVVTFTNDEGKPDGVAFRDGARMGTRGRSGPIYQAVRNAKK